MSVFISDTDLAQLYVHFFTLNLNPKIIVNEPFLSAVCSFIKVLI